MDIYLTCRLAYSWDISPAKFLITRKPTSSENKIWFYICLFWTQIQPPPVRNIWNPIKKHNQIKNDVTKISQNVTIGYADHYILN